MEDGQKMVLRIAEFVPYAGHQHLDLFDAPAEDSRQRRKGESLDTSYHVLSLVATHVFELLVLRPGSDRDLKRVSVECNWFNGDTHVP